MMAQLTGKKNTRLLRRVEEKALEEEQKKKMQAILIPYLPKDCVSSILIRLPLDSIPRSRFVCKPWYNIINGPTFIDAHLHRSESVLIFETSVSKGHLNAFSMTSNPPEKPNTFLVERNLLKSVPIFGHPIINSSPKFCIQFMEFKDGNCEIRDYNVNCLGNIRATCNGLVLLDNKLKRGGLIVMNPVTRKLIALPLGTLFPPHNESYGFALCELTGVYKVVHLFRDGLGYVSCEILNLETRFWREVNGPSSGHFSWFGYRPVSAIGALHWVPHIDHSNYIVSMELDKETFHTVPLPEECRCYDRIIEMGGFLCFVTHKGENQMDIWILKEKDIDGHDWRKQHSITVGCLMDMVPISSLRISREIVFKREEDGSFYAYDCNLEVLRKVDMENGCMPSSSSFLPHVNSLISWDRQNVHD